MRACALRAAAALAAAALLLVVHDAAGSQTAPPPPVAHGDASAPPPAPPPPVSAAPHLLAPANVPAALLAAARQMEATRVTSERFSVGTAVTSTGTHVPRELQRFLKLLFDARLSGVASSSPPAGDFQLTIFGQTLRLRVVHGHTYLNVPAVGTRDGGRPWIDLGRAGLAALFGSAAPSPASGAERESFAKLAAALRAARAVLSLGPGTVDGEAVTGYRAVVPSSTLHGESSRAAQARGALGGAFGGRALPAGEAPDENVLLEVFVTPAGVPVRAHMSLTAEGLSVSALSDVYAINFPLVVAPPRRRQTIALAALRRLERGRGTARRG